MTAQYSILGWLQLIRTARQILRQAADLLDLPDPDDAQETFAWSRAVITLAAQIAQLTPTKTDDQIINWLLDGPLATYENFQPYHRIFQAILHALANDEEDGVAAEKIARAVGPIANPMGMPPITLILTLIQIFRLIRDLMK